MPTWVGRAQEGRMNDLKLLIQELTATLWFAVILNLMAMGKRGESQCRPEQPGRPQRNEGWSRGGGKGKV